MNWQQHLIFSPELPPISADAENLIRVSVLRELPLSIELSLIKRLVSSNRCLQLISIGVLILRVSLTLHDL